MPEHHLRLGITLFSQTGRNLDTVSDIQIGLDMNEPPPGRCERRFKLGIDLFLKTVLNLDNLSDIQIELDVNEPPPGRCESIMQCPYIAADAYALFLVCCSRDVSPALPPELDQAEQHPVLQLPSCQRL